MKVLSYIVRLVRGFLSDCDPRRVPAKREDGLLLAKVKRVLDGDGVLVTVFGMDISVRLSAIDCPEHDQEWGGIAKAGLIKLIGGRDVLLEQHGVDIHGRTLATVYTMNGNGLVNVNERMVAKGHAWVYREFYGHLSWPRRDQLNSIERWAQRNRVGLWRNSDPVAPWEWRRIQNY